MIRAHPVPNKQKAARICGDFLAGAPTKAEGAVFYGVNADNARDWYRAQAAGDWYYIDNSYFDSVRGQQYRVTKNRLQVNPFGVASDGKRFDALGLTIAPMNARPSDLWIVVEQSPSFMQYVASDPFWIDRVVARSIPKGHRVKVRRWAPDKIKQQETLPADLAEAWTLVTHSSAAAVTAALMGVPAIVSPTSAMYYGRWSTFPEHDERRAYLNVLADNQWTLEEIRNGKAWEWLNSKKS